MHLLVSVSESLLLVFLQGSQEICVWPTKPDPHLRRTPTREHHSHQHYRVARTGMFSLNNLFVASLKSHLFMNIIQGFIHKLVFFCCYASIYSFRSVFIMNLLVQPSLLPFIYPSMSIHPYISLYQPLHTSLYPSIQAAQHASISLCIYARTPLVTHASISLSICAFIIAFIHLFMHYSCVFHLNLSQCRNPYN